MDHNLEDSLTLEGMDFDHSEDVVNQEDIPLEDPSGLNNITLAMDSAREQSHTLMESGNDEVIVSDLIEDPFPFQEFTIQNPVSSHNIMIDPHQMNQTTSHDPGVSMQYTETSIKAPASTKSNTVAVKVAQPKPTKRMVATAPLRQVAIAPKPVQTKPVQYAIAPKPVALITSKHNVGTINKIPISSGGNVKGNTVLAQIGRQLVMVPKKIKLMSSTSTEGIINSSSTGLQYQVACTPDQAQLISNKGSKPLVKFIQVQGQSSTDKSTNSPLFTKVVTPNGPRARYVMQQKTVPISIGGNKVIQNLKIAGKKKIIAIKAQSPKVQATPGNVATKKVVISTNANQKVLIRTSAPTSTTQVIKDTGTMGQRTQYHPINVPGKGIQYIKLVTNQPPPKPGPTKPLAVPSKNFVFTDNKGNVIQVTAEKVVSGQSIITTKGIVKPLKSQKKLVRIAPVSKAVSQSISQPVRSAQSLLAPITTATASQPAVTAPMTSLPTISSPVTLSQNAEAAVSLEEFNDMVEQDNDNGIQQSYNLSNYIDNSRYSDTNDFSVENDFSTATDDYSTANEYSTAEDTSQMHDELHEDSIDPDETVDIKPTLQSLISDAVGEERESENEMENMHEVEIEFESKPDSIRNASFMLQDDSNIKHNTSHTSGMNEESIIIVPGSNYTEKANQSVYSDETQSYRSRRHSYEDRKHVPYLSVEAECVPYTEQMLPESPPPLSEPDTAANLDLRPRKACNCTKSQCLKLYCDCFANGEFCNNCNCNNCHNNLENEEVRQKAIRSCLERNPNAFRPKIGKSKTGGPEIIRRHTKGCNCKRSGCLKNYCECYEAKIACTAMCKCVGCRNVEETLVRRRDAIRLREKLSDQKFRPAPVAAGPVKQPCSFMTTEVIEAVCQCLLATAGEGGARREPADTVADVIDEFARCLQDVITASHHTL